MIQSRKLSLAAKELNWSQKQFNDYVNSERNGVELRTLIAAVDKKTGEIKLVPVKVDNK